MIHLILATDAKGLHPNATLINSVLANTEEEVHVRIFSRELAPQGFTLGRLRLEVIETPEALRLEGRVPAHVSSGPAFDRIAALAHCTDWDRALIMDYDQLVVGDLADLFSMDLTNFIGAARMWHEDLGTAARNWFGEELPESWKHCEGYQHFYMGPLIDLAAFRREGCYERFLEYHATGRMEEQIALTVACQDKILPLPPCYNLVPQWDGLPADARVLHFTGPQKPWSHAEMLGAHLWRHYETDWATLTGGKWCPEPPGIWLHLGCGFHRLSGWRNSDLDPTKCDPDTPPIDITKPLPFSDNSVDGVYAEHLIEHISWQDGVNFLRECHRVLKPNGTARMVTPHLERLSHELQAETVDARRYLDWSRESFPWNIPEASPAHVLNNLFRDWGHQFLHTPSSLRDAFQKAGFPNDTIVEKPVEDSCESKMRGIGNYGRIPEGLLAFEALAMEGTKAPATITSQTLWEQWQSFHPTQPLTSAQHDQILQIGGNPQDLPAGNVTDWLAGREGQGSWLIRAMEDDHATKEIADRSAEMMNERGLDDRLRIMDGDVREMLAWLNSEDGSWEKFDFILFYPGFQESVTLAEFCSAWSLLKAGGWMLAKPSSFIQREFSKGGAWKAIEAFKAAFADQVQRCEDEGNQVWFQKAGVAGDNCLRIPKSPAS